ncbi:uncharacterized protein LOC9660605 isoform X1 [Selaginella moellendorffii]|uniref:uncharacterized protein LOC9660605 isoform X1 n=1 Tax=Selaginella moellendorffii TaxID=88036 RepID=UPI000D1CAA54|nr:uncharacterized protein LOC9660605 isoform X1 [Selaginella moellendorffii]|eukprot:XP_024530161.1 uncharacterized protein LOC9660605 isoform X1 [Selaginella moellendorffii]
MKASAKLRDGQEPLLRAKIPLNILGLPICSGVSMGSSQELGLHVSTLVAAGPSCRVTFLPNDSHAPVCVMLKAGFGPWGSPVGSCLAISAQLKLPTWSQQRPSFSISLKPRNGDFMLLKNVRGIELKGRKPSKEESPDEATATNGVSVAELAKAFDKEKTSSTKNVNGCLEDDGWVIPDAGTMTRTRTRGFSSTPAAFKGWSVAAHSSLPLGQRVYAGIRWRVGVPGDLVETLASNPHKLWSRLSSPVLKLDKITLYSIEPKDDQAKPDSMSDSMAAAHQAWMEENQELNKVAAMCSSIRRQLHLVYSENRVLRNTLEEMRRNFNSRGSTPTEMPSSIVMDKALLPLADYENVHRSQQSPIPGKKEFDADATAPAADKNREQRNQYQSKQHKPRPPDTAAVAPEKSVPPPPPAPSASAVAKELKKAINASKST